jgi:hypothetical protein
MFIVRPTCQWALDEALEVLERHTQPFEEIPRRGHAMPMLVVGPEHGNFPEAEFQFNWNQTGERLCEVCKTELEKTGEGFSCCGHLTFDKPKYSR